jgi:hypothetical protein
MTSPFPHAAQRKPARDAYDAVVDLLPVRGPAERAYAIVKRSFTIAGSRCAPAAAEPLSGDFRRPSPTARAGEGCPPPLPPRSDFWPRKDATDFIIDGAAFAPGGKPACTMMVSAQLGATRKRVAVFGRRHVERSPSGAPRVAVPEPFTEMPLSFANAYGGVDTRVPFDEGRCMRVGDQLLAGDHPGLYPRNPFGKGYVIGSLPSGEVEMPNLEDPDDLLVEDRLVVRDPALWYRQPLPWCFHWMHMLMFPRFVYFLGADAWFPGPDDEEMPEVRRGYLTKHYRAALADGLSPRLAQEASLGLSVAGLAGGEPVVLEGMHPEEPVLRFSLPAPPHVEFILEGHRVAAAPRLHSVVIRPAEKRLYMVYGADVELHRTFVPGIHKRIPVAVSVDGDAPIAYAVPPTVKEQLRAAGAKG